MGISNEMIGGRRADVLLSSFSLLSQSLIQEREAAVRSSRGGLRFIPDAWRGGGKESRKAEWLRRTE
jgi:hypothetical protein